MRGDRLATNYAVIDDQLVLIINPNYRDNEGGLSDSEIDKVIDNLSAKMGVSLSRVQAELIGAKVKAVWVIPTDKLNALHAALSSENAHLSKWGFAF